MARWERSIEIAAPPDRVWAVVADVEQWPTWTDSILSVEKAVGDLGVGATALVHAKGTPKSEFRVTRWEPGRGFDWQTRARGSTAIAGHWIEPAGEGRSKALLSVEVPGLLGAFFKPLIGKGIRANLELEAEGLKRRSESAAP